MSEQMEFPKKWEQFLHDYEFEDKRQIYTNGSRLIPSFRVKQMMEHYLSEAVDLIDRQKAEIERLKGWQDLLKAEKHSLIKAEAVKEFLKKAKDLSYESRDWSHGEHPFVVEWEDLMTIYDEMVGDL